MVSSGAKTSGNTPSAAGSWRLTQAALCVLLLAAYLLVYAGRFHVIDEVSLYTMGESLAKRGTFDTDQIVWTQWVPRAVRGAG